MSKFIDLVGKRFGMLTIIKRVNNDKCGNLRWLCSCDCGKEKIIRGGSLKSGDTKSCECLSKEKTIERQTTHGHWIGGNASKIYNAWCHMIQRCTNVDDIGYKNYGGRGIKVCKRWRSFPNFLEDMGEPPTKKHSIHRIDNEGDYNKDNCEWATKKQQARNRRNNHLITFNGKTQCVSELAEETRIPYNTLWARIYKLGWSVEKALTTPVRKRSK